MVRIDGVVRERLIELNAEQTDYTLLDPAAEDLTEGWSVIEWVLKDAREKFTRADILTNGPMREKPNPASLWKWLEQTVADGRLKRDGEGRPHKPFGYWLHSSEKHFFPDLPDLDPPPYTPEITDEEYEYFQKVVDPGEEKRRRAKVLKEQGGAVNLSPALTAFPPPRWRRLLLDFAAKTMMSLN